MALVTKQNPVGIDVYIQNLQSALYANFVEEWNLDSEVDWNCYGRIYRLFDSEGKEYLPYPFDSGNEYEKPALFEDTVKLQSFFDILETQKLDDALQSSLKVVLYFFGDLTKIFGDNNDRFDETMAMQVASFVQQIFNFRLHSKRIGIKTIMKDWNGYTNDYTKSSNEQPLYAFALEFEISEYYICYSNSLINYTQGVVLIPPNIRTQSSGIDQWIQNCQVNLYNYLLTIFNGTINGYGNITQVQYSSFGRIYRNFVADKKQYFPQAYIGNNEYQNVLFEDSVVIQSFFDVGETMREDEHSLLTYVNIHAYFFVDLSLLYPNATTRMDEEFIILISQFLMENSGFILVEIQRGIKAIMNEYSGYQIKSNSKANMQPFLCFRCDMKKYYDESFNNCQQLLLNIF